MRCHCFWTCLAALVLTAAGAPAQSYTIKLKHAPDVGKSVVVKDNDEKTQATKVFDADGKALGGEMKHTEKLDEVYTEVVLAKGDKFPTKYKRTYEKAARTLDGKVATRSYEGRTVVFEQKDGKFVVSAEDDKPLDKADLEDLTKKANDSDDDKDDVFLPKKAVKVGDSWKIDTKELVKSFAKNGELDAENTGGEAKLTKVYKKDGHQFGTIEMTLKLAPKLKDVKFEKPPVVEMKIALDAAIDGSSSEGTMTMTGKMASKLTAEQMGKKFTVDTTMELSGKKAQSAEK